MSLNTTPILFSKDSTPLGTDELFVLIQQCRSKDKRAQKHLYDRFAPTFYAKIRRYLNETSDANEVLNESFYKILTKLDDYAETGSFEGWMHRIVINTTMDFLRKRIKIQNKIVYTEVEEQQIQVPETIIGKLAYQELLALVHALPDIQRSVFNLFVFEDYPHKEIAMLLGITENNSRWHLNDARRRLKEKIDALI